MTAETAPAASDYADQVDYVVCLYRPTRDVERMSAFLETLGLHRTVRRDVDGAAFVWGRGGMVALFPMEGAARASHSELTLETTSLDAAEQALQQAGLATHRVSDTDFPGISVSAPQGRTLWVAESFRDPDDQGEDYPHHALDVLAVHHSSNAEDAVGLFEVFGFRPRERGQDPWPILVRDGLSGAIAIDSAGQPPEPGPIMVQLAISTEEPLAEVAQRLDGVGHQAALATTRDGLPYLRVSDPDEVGINVFQVGTAAPGR